ncbi:hypothetical protein [Oryzifoliimicrobium ureilyticus]|uniref:hypothetical protein n=1 Tax=Oryzifoliimicrobium ureilyticus TaxID=3113724 RepID=UPI003F66EBDF
MKNEAKELADQYVKLGGQRKSKIDDNITNVRQWDQDSPEAEKFWAENIASLDEDRRKQVEDFLPSINAV